MYHLHRYFQFFSSLFCPHLPRPRANIHVAPVVHGWDRTAHDRGRERQAHGRHAVARCAQVSVGIRVRKQADIESLGAAIFHMSVMSLLVLDYLTTKLFFWGLFVSYLRKVSLRANMRPQKSHLWLRSLV